MIVVLYKENYQNFNYLGSLSNCATKLHYSLDDTKN